MATLSPFPKSITTTCGLYSSYLSSLITTFLFRYSRVSTPSTTLSIISSLSYRLISLKYSSYLLASICPTFTPQISRTRWNFRGKSQTTNLSQPLGAVVLLVTVLYILSPSSFLKRYLPFLLLKVSSIPISFQYFSRHSSSFFSALLRSSFRISISLACAEFILMSLSSSFSTDFNFFSTQQVQVFSYLSLFAYSWFIFYLRIRLFSSQILRDSISMLFSFSASCAMRLLRLLFSCSILALSRQFSSALKYSSYFLLTPSLEYLFLVSRVHSFSMEVSMYSMNFILRSKRPACLTCWQTKSIFQWRNYIFQGSCTGRSVFILGDVRINKIGNQGSRQQREGGGGGGRGRGDESRGVSHFLLLFRVGVAMAIDDPRDIMIPLLQSLILALVLLHLLVVMLGRLGQLVGTHIFQFPTFVLFDSPPQTFVVLLHALRPLKLLTQLLHQLDVLVAEDVVALLLIFFLAERGEVGFFFLVWLGVALCELIGMGFEMVGLAELMEDVGVGEGLH